MTERFYFCERVSIPGPQRAPTKLTGPDAAASRPQTLPASKHNQLL